MIKVIETNLSLDDNENIVDHQSRVIEVESWEDYIEEIKENISVFRKSISGCLSGYTISKKSEISNIIYDEFHLSCDTYNSAGAKSKKLAYKNL